jgi:hypothetical protein
VRVFFQGGSTDYLSLRAWFSVKPCGVNRDSIEDYPMLISNYYVENAPDICYVVFNPRNRKVKTLSFRVPARNLLWPSGGCHAKQMVFCCAKAYL